MRIVEAADWVVMTWRCADEEQAMRRASGLHTQEERDEFMRRYHWLVGVRLLGDNRAADEIIRRGYVRLARRQPLIPGQTFVLMQALGDSAVVAPSSDCMMVLGSLLGAWYPRVCHDRKAVYMMAMSDDVAGIVKDGDEFVPIYQGWKTRERYGVRSDDDADVVERVDGSAVTISTRMDDDAQYGGSLSI